jgi:hypothetical protein
VTPLRRALLAHDLLDPDDAHELRQRLAAQRPKARRTTRTAAPTQRSTWRIPPPAMGWPARLRSPSVLGGTQQEATQQVRIGDRFQIHIDDLPDADQQILVVLQRIGLADWTVLSPVSDSRLHTLSSCRLSPEGARKIDLLARGPVGRQRWAVALLPAPIDVDFTLPAPQRWSGVQRLISQGGVRISAVDVDVIGTGGPSALATP